MKIIGGNGRGLDNEKTRLVEIEPGDVGKQYIIHAYTQEDGGVGLWVGRPVNQVDEKPLDDPVEDAPLPAPFWVKPAAVEEKTQTLRDMSLEALRHQQHQWYEGARQDGSLTRCYDVGRILGERLNARYGPKYSFHEGALEIYVDDYGNFFTAHWNGKEVMSTHPCTTLFIPGEWMEIVNRLHPAALEKQRLEQEARKERERQVMIDRLGGR